MSVAHTHTRHGQASCEAGAAGLNSAEVMTETAGVYKTFKSKVVHVRDYLRVRFGKLEHVRAHWRSLPGQLSFDF
ncbi:hypothetical protein DK26_19460 [Bosea sp. WAO]|nr:hypothetical protein DK26_19460 [Bosea sp. WAO]